MAFWDLVEKTDDCWLWKGAQTKGYGQCTIGKRHKYAHRASWELEHGEIPKGKIVCHACDVPLCVKPSHLFLGSQADNIRDCIAKGRDNRRGLSGASNPAARSIPSINADYILSLFRNGTGVREIAPIVGLSKSTVHNIVSGKHWSVRNGF